MLNIMLQLVNPLELGVYKHLCIQRTCSLNTIKKFVEFVDKFSIISCFFSPHRLNIKMIKSVYNKHLNDCIFIKMVLKWSFKMI